MICLTRSDRFGSDPLQALAYGFGCGVIRYDTRLTRACNAALFNSNRIDIMAQPLLMIQTNGSNHTSVGVNDIDRV